MKALLLAGLVLLTLLATVPSGSAAPPEPQCMDVYSRTDVGQLSIVRRDSCHVESTGAPSKAHPSPSATRWCSE